MRILFQGDSLTDCGRDRSDPHNLGKGYAFYAAQQIVADHPDKEFEFFNFGISGDQTKNLVYRLQTDLIDIKPDFASVLIGVNDAFQIDVKGSAQVPHDVFEKNYRIILDALKAMNTKILMIEPFLFPKVEGCPLPKEDLKIVRPDLDAKIQIVRKLAREYADAYIPADGLLAAKIVTEEQSKFSDDSVHLKEYGSRILGKVYADTVKDIIANM